MYKDKRGSLLTYYFKLVKIQWCNILAIQGFYLTHMSFDRLSKAEEHERKKNDKQDKEKTNVCTCRGSREGELAYPKERLTYPVLKT